jgi:hypothetical protein
MVVVDIQNLAGCDTTNKAFVAFEKRGAGQGVKGVYFLSLTRLVQHFRIQTLYSTTQRK